MPTSPSNWQFCELADRSIGASATGSFRRRRQQSAPLRAIGAGPHDPTTTGPAGTRFDGRRRRNPAGRCRLQCRYPEVSGLRLMACPIDRVQANWRNGMSASDLRRVRGRKRQMLSAPRRKMRHKGHFYRRLSSLGNGPTVSAAGTHAAVSVARAICVSQKRLDIKESRSFFVPDLKSVLGHSGLEGGSDHFVNRL